MKKIISIIGARPQFIKASPVHNQLATDFELVSLHTGQHYDQNLSNIFFKEFNLDEPEYNLNIGSGNHGEQSGKMLIGVEQVLLKENPDLVIVYGDTNSTISGTLAAIKLHIPTAHVEAGMRSFNRHMPEEVNRVATDHLSNVNFCVTKTSVNNLRKEGISKNVYLVGDTMYDVFNKMKNLRDKKILKQYGLEEDGYTLTTIHRASNTENPANLKSIIKALISSKEKIVFPAHPRTIKYLESNNLLENLKKKKNILLLPPQGYIENLSLMSYAKKILTDSGGMQKEAYFLKKPCITLREETEWVETLENGWNILVGTSEEKIIQELSTKKIPGKYEHIYGNGSASKKIVEIINQFLETNDQ